MQIGLRKSIDRNERLVKRFEQHHSPHFTRTRALSDQSFWLESERNLGIVAAQSGHAGQRGGSGIDQLFVQSSGVCTAFGNSLGSTRHQSNRVPATRPVRRCLFVEKWPAYLVGRIRFVGRHLVSWVSSDDERRRTRPNCRLSRPVQQGARAAQSRSAHLWRNVGRVSVSDAECGGCLRSAIAAVLFGQWQSARNVGRSCSTSPIVAEDDVFTSAIAIGRNRGERSERRRQTRIESNEKMENLGSWVWIQNANAGQCG